MTHCVLAAECDGRMLKEITNSLGIKMIAPSTPQLPPLHFTVFAVPQVLCGAARPRRDGYQSLAQADALKTPGAAPSWASTSALQALQPPSGAKGFAGVQPAPHRPMVGAAGSRFVEHLDAPCDARAVPTVPSKQRTWWSALLLPFTLYWSMLLSGCRWLFLGGGKTA